MQNLVGIDSAVTDLRMREKNGLCGFFINISIRPFLRRCIGGVYTRVYAVYQPPGFLTAYTHLSDHK